MIEYILLMAGTLKRASLSIAQMVMENHIQTLSSILTVRCSIPINTIVTVSEKNSAKMEARSEAVKGELFMIIIIMFA